MTQQERQTFDEYGTAYPCCGNCANIREAAFRLMCKLNYDYRDYSSVKCVYYKYSQNTPILEELMHND